MEAYGFAFQQVVVEKNVNVVFFVIYQTKRGNRTRADAEVFHHPLVGSKTEFALFELFFEFVDAHLPRMFQYYKVMAVPFMVSKEQVLAMRGIQVFPIFHGYLDGRGGWMFVVIELNAKFRQGFVKFWGTVHRGDLRVGDWGLGF